MLSAVYASLGGSLFAHHVTHVSPSTFDPLASVVVVVMAVIGGLASIWGAIFGAGTIMILKNELLVVLDVGEWEIVAYGLRLMLVMIFMPEGLFVKLKETYARFKENRAQRSLERHERGAVFPLRPKG